MKTTKTKTVSVAGCLYPDCGRGAINRGLCHSHYVTALRYVKKKLVTWEEMEKNGKSLPPHQGRKTKAASWFIS